MFRKLFYRMLFTAVLLTFLVACGKTPLSSGIVEPTAVQPQSSEVAETLTIRPAEIAVVPTPVPVTEGRRYSLETIAAWDVSPPISVTAAFIFVKTGDHDGFVVGATKI